MNICHCRINSEGMQLELRVTNVDFNIFEDMEISGVNVSTVSQGIVVYQDGDVRTEKGAGRYIDRPCYAPYYGAIEKRSAATAPGAVDRS